jgi:multiple sugar transport system substrate-binding protein
LPAKREVALSPKNLADPLSGPMLQGLTYASTTDFVAEEAQGQIFQDMLDRVLCKIRILSRPSSRLRSRNRR